MLLSADSLSSHRAMCEQVSESLNGQFHKQRSARACFQFWQKLEKTCGLKNGEEWLEEEREEQNRDSRAARGAESEKRTSALRRSPRESATHKAPSFYLHRSVADTAAGEAERALAMRIARERERRKRLEKAKEPKPGRCRGISRNYGKLLEKTRIKLGNNIYK